MPGDRVTTEEGREVEFRHERQEMAPRVVTLGSMWKTFLAVLGFLVVFAVWAGDARIDQRIALHTQDAEAHFSMVRILDSSIANDKAKDVEIQRLTTQIDALQRDVRDLRDTIAELKALMREPRKRQ